MPRRKKVEVKESYFTTVPYLEIDGFAINRGDIIKVIGEHGARFKFVGLTTNTLTGSFWVDCFEIINAVPSVFRSFRVERIKRIPIRKKRAKRVN